MVTRIVGGQIVRYRARREPEPIQHYFDSVQVLATGGVFQQISKFNTTLKNCLLQNISNDKITVRVGMEDSDPTDFTEGDGMILGSSSDGEGGGVMRLSKPNLSRFYWTAETTGAKLVILRVLQ